MTRRDTIQCVHEPFGDAFYYGPERLGSRYMGDEHAQTRRESGFGDSTYNTVLERIEREASEVRPSCFPVDHGHPLFRTSIYPPSHSRIPVGSPSPLHALAHTVPPVG